MSLTLVVEDGTGLANANAFASLVSVSAVLDAQPYASAWATTDPTLQNQCIAEASSWLSQLLWDGVPITDTQALAFPRAWMTTPDGYAISPSTVPTWLVHATARLAFFLSQQATSPYNATGLEPGSQLRIYGLHLKPATPGEMPVDIRRMIAPYARFGSAIVRA